MRGILPALGSVWPRRCSQDQDGAYAAAVARRYHVGSADNPATTIAGVISRVQFDKIQRHIESGIMADAILAAGGPGRPDGLKLRFHVRPIVFGNVTPTIPIAREGVFGVLRCIMPYGPEDEAVVNDIEHGLAAYVQCDDLARARRMARRLQAENVHINYPHGMQVCRSAVSDVLATASGMPNTGWRIIWG